MATTARIPPPPATGNARWRGLPVTEAALDLGHAWLSITATTKGGLVRSDFWVKRLTEAGKVVGYRLTQFEPERGRETGKVYDIDVSFGPLPEHWTCSCPDAVWQPVRPGGCKHIAATHAAMQKANLL